MKRASEGKRKYDNQVGDMAVWPYGRMAVIETARKVASLYGSAVLGTTMAAKDSKSGLRQSSRLLSQYRNVRLAR